MVINANRGVVMFNDNAFVENSAEYGGVLMLKTIFPVWKTLLPVTIVLYTFIMLF